MHTGNDKDCDVILESVTKRFGNVTAMDKVSFRIERGAFVTLLGPSGCGKTTTLRVIGGFEIPTEGRVYIRGRDVGSIPPYKRETNLVFQDYALFPHMSVMGNIGFGLKMKGVPKPQIRQKVEKVLRLVGLPNLGHRRPHQLSGGQRQRVALCRALVLEPAVLLLDEPLGALDAKIRKQMQTELKSLQQELGLTFISVTHDQEEAMTMSDEIIIMNEGRVIQSGPPQEVYEKPGSKFLATFLGDCNLIDGEVVRMEDGKTVFRAPVPGDLNVSHPGEESQPFPEGEAALMVRPENIRLGRDAELLENSFQGGIRDVVFKGALTEFVIDVDSFPLKVQVQGIQQFQRGENVTVGWSERDCHLIRHSEKDGIE